MNIHQEGFESDFVIIHVLPFLERVDAFRACGVCVCNLEQR